MRNPLQYVSSQLFEKETHMETRIASDSAVYNLGSISRIPMGEGRTFRVNETLVTIFRMRDGNVFATQSTCPHRAGSLADGLVGGGKVICPLHGYAFDLATGQALENPCEKLRTYPVSLNVAGDILLTLAADQES
jgi:nitrite reductase (NADH) small subunit